MKKMKDVIFLDGSRATFLFDPTTKSYQDQPYVVIQKTRLDDFNIKAGVG